MATDEEKKKKAIQNFEKKENGKHQLDIQRRVLGKEDFFILLLKREKLNEGECEYLLLEPIRLVFNTKDFFTVKVGYIEVGSTFCLEKTSPFYHLTFKDLDQTDAIISFHTDDIEFHNPGDTQGGKIIITKKREEIPIGSVEILFRIKIHNS